MLPQYASLLKADSNHSAQRKVHQSFKKKKLKNRVYGSHNSSEYGWDYFFSRVTVHLLLHVNIPYPINYNMKTIIYSYTLLRGSLFFTFLTQTRV